MSSDRSFAFLTGPTRLPIAGAAAPACEVEKNTGSIASKSCSSRICCTRTDPTIPRHPMSPTFMMGISLSTPGLKPEAQGELDGACAARARRRRAPARTADRAAGGGDAAEERSRNELARRAEDGAKRRVGLRPVRMVEDVVRLCAELHGAPGGEPHLLGERAVGRPRAEAAQPVAHLVAVRHLVARAVGARRDRERGGIEG